MLDLHMHLDGSLPISVVRKLMINSFSNLDDNLKRIISNGEELKARLQVPMECDSLQEYLKCFDLPLSILQTRSSVRIAVKRILENLKEEGIRYVEIRFAPQLHSQDYLLADDKFAHEMQIVQAAIKASNEVQGIKCNFILCMMRGASQADNLRTLRIAENYKNRGVVAVDLAGNEAMYHTIGYRYEFWVAKEMGLDFTIHAGEAGSMEQRINSISEAVLLGAKRIGHGVGLSGSPELRQLCKESEVGIECCPTSNVQTKAVESVDSHPIRNFMKEGLMVSVNTDNRTVSNTTIEKEFEVINASAEERKILIKNAIDMAFLSDKEKKEIFPEWVK